MNIIINKNIFVIQKAFDKAQAIIDWKHKSKMEKKKARKKEFSR